MKTLTLVMAMMASSNLMAATVTKWDGNGSVFTPDGQLLETYKVSVQNTEMSPDVTDSQTTVTTSDGHTQLIQQTITVAGEHWTVVSNLGKGSGQCYGDDLCENYIEGNNGAAYYTTIIGDGPG